MVELHHYAKFCRNRFNRSRDITIFRYFKMAAAAVLDFRNLTFLTVRTVKRVKQHHGAKFRRNRLNRGRDMAIFRYFKMSAAAILHFKNFKIFNDRNSQHHGQKVEVNTFRYLGAMFDSDAGYATEVRSRISQGRERMGMLSSLWRSRTLSPQLKTRLIQTLVWPILTYGSEAWTLNKELTDNIEAFEMWCYRRALRISYVEHVSNDEVLGRVQQTRKLGSRIRLQKLRHFGHVSCHPSF